MGGILNLTGQTATTGGDPNFRLSVGSVLQRSISVWAANFLPFSLVGLVVYSPVLVALVAAGLAGLSAVALARVLNLVSNLLGLVLTGAVTYGVFQQLRGQRAGVADILRTGMSRFGSVFGAGLLFGLAVGLSFLCFIIPGLFVLAMGWVTVPVAIIETPGASAAFERSKSLTEGNRWRILALALVMGFAVIFVAVCIGLVLGAAGLLPEDGDGANGSTNVWAEALLILLLIPIHCLNAIAPAVAYHDLRLGKEGVDVEELLKAFE